MSKYLIMTLILLCCGFVAQEVLDERFHNWVNFIVFVLAIPLGWKVISAPFDKALKDWYNKHN